MAAFVISFVIFILVMVAMAVGVIFGRKPIAGSCGGIANLGMERACGCVDVCKNEQDQPSAKDVHVDTKSKIEIYRP